MTQKQKLAALFLSLSLTATSGALAQNGAPASQFGFKGWPYRYWPEACATAQPEPTATPQTTAAPSVEPTAAPTPTMQPTVQPTAQPKPTATKTPSSTDDDYTTPSISVQEENAFFLLNQDRKNNGRAALVLDPALSEIARAKSRDMHLNNYFAHTSPTYGTVSQMLKHFGYAFTSVSENIAHHATVEKAQAAFMSSANHRRTALGSQWSKVGIGVWKDSQGFVYVTQLFVR